MVNLILSNYYLIVVDIDINQLIYLTNLTIILICCLLFL